MHDDGSLRKLHTFTCFVQFQGSCHLEHLEPLRACNHQHGSWRYDQRHQGTTHHQDNLVNRKRFSKRLCRRHHTWLIWSTPKHKCNLIHCPISTITQQGLFKIEIVAVASSNHGSVLYMARQARSMVRLTSTPPPQEAAAAAAVPFPGKICLAMHKRGCTACSLWNSENLACLIAFLAGHVVCSMHAFCLSVVWKLMPSQLQRFLQSFSLMTLHE